MTALKRWLARHLAERTGTEYRHKATGRRTIVCDEGEGFAARNPLWVLVGPVYRVAALSADRSQE